MASTMPYHRTQNIICTPFTSSVIGQLVTENLKMAKYNLCSAQPLISIYLKKKKTLTFGISKRKLQKCEALIYIHLSIPFLPHLFSDKLLEVLRKGGFGLGLAVWHSCRWLTSDWLDSHITWSLARLRTWAARGWEQQHGAAYALLSAQTHAHTLTLVLREFTDSRWEANMLRFTGGIKHWVLEIKACKSISTDECHRNKRDVGEMQYFKDHHCSFVLLLSEELCYWSQGEWKLVKITSVEMYVSIYAF